MGELAGGRAQTLYAMFREAELALRGQVSVATPTTTTTMGKVRVIPGLVYLLLLYSIYM
jgi:hypothetical protein